MAIKFATALTGGMRINGKLYTYKDACENVEFKKAVRRTGSINCEIQGREYIFVWGEGHIGELAPMEEYDPVYGEWDGPEYPLIPQKIRIVPNENKMRYINTFADAISKPNAEYIISATDFGREGENIFYFAKEVASRKAGKTLPYKRVRINEITEEGIKRGFRKLYSAEENKPREVAARCRAQADWVIGLNLTRCATIANNKMYNVGRVMTPTLALVVNRENEIDNFTPKTTYVINGEFKTPSGDIFYGKLDHEPFETKKDAENYFLRLGKGGSVTEVTRKKQRSFPAGPFDTASAQAAINKRHGIELAEIDEALQNLYDNGYITYPRTDSRYFTEDLKGDAENRIQCLIKGYKKFASIFEGKDVLVHDRFFNNKKVADHYGIITTTKIPSSSLSETEKKVYAMIATEFAKTALPTCVIGAVSADVQCGSEIFKCTGKVMIDPGYTVLNPNLPECENAIPNSLKAKDKVEASFFITESKKTKPQRYTQGTLIEAMQKAGNLLDNPQLKDALKTAKGLGTGATRTGTIEKLLSKGVEQLEMDEKKKLRPTSKGKFIISNIPVGGLKSPELTAMLEVKLSEIEDSEVSETEANKMGGAFMQEISTSTKKWCADILAHKKRVDIKKFQCPCCGEPLTLSRYDYPCSNQDCLFKIPKFPYGSDMAIEEQDIKALLSGKKTRLFTFQNKSGSGTHKAPLEVTDGKVKRFYERTN